MPYADPAKRKAQATQWRLDHPQESLEATRRYQKKHKDEINARARAYRQTKEGKIATSLANKKSSNKHKERINIYNKVFKANLKKTPCIVCGVVKVHAHHYDYSKPLDVKYLCPLHHKWAHLSISELLLKLEKAEKDKYELKNQ